MRVSTDSAQLFFSLLTFVAAGGAILLVVLRIAAAAGSDGARRAGVAIHEVSIWLAFLVAATATVGSLYFSEVADFVPCRLCWFQRIAMYPLAAVLLVGAIRRDAAVRWYAAPLAVIGALISGYHSVIEWRPDLDSGACDASGPSCTDVWFREFEFMCLGHPLGVTLATMALVGFLTILLLLFVNFPTVPDDRLGDDEVRPPDHSMEHAT